MSICISFIRLGTLDLKIELGQSYFNRMEQIRDLNILEEQFTYFPGVNNVFFLLVGVNMADYVLGLLH